MSQLRQIERRRVFSTLSEPADAIASLRRCAHFAALVRRHKPDLDGVTVLVPNDGAFLGQRGDRAEIRLVLIFAAYVKRTRVQRCKHEQGRRSRGKETGRRPQVSGRRVRARVLGRPPHRRALHRHRPLGRGAGAAAERSILAALRDHVRSSPTPLSHGLRLISDRRRCRRATRTRGTRCASGSTRAARASSGSTRTPSRRAAPSWWRATSGARAARFYTSSTRFCTRGRAEIFRTTRAEIFRTTRLRGRSTSMPASSEYHVDLAGIRISQSDAGD